MATNPSFTPAIPAEVTSRIQDLVAHLEVPPEAILLRAHQEVALLVDARLRTLEHDLDEAEAAAVEAIASILLDTDDLERAPNNDYFKRS